MFVKRSEPNDTGVQRFKKWFILIPSYHCCYYHYYYTSHPKPEEDLEKMKANEPWRQKPEQQNSLQQTKHTNPHSGLLLLESEQLRWLWVLSRGGSPFLRQRCPTSSFPDGECIHRHWPSKRGHVTLMVTMQILFLGAGWVLQSVEWHFTKRVWWVYRVHRFVPIQLRLTPHQSNGHPHSTTGGHSTDRLLYFPVSRLPPVIIDHERVTLLYFQ